MISFQNFLLQRKWWIPDSGKLKKFTISIIGDSWKDEKLKLYKDRVQEMGNRSQSTSQRRVVYTMS